VRDRPVVAAGVDAGASLRVAAPTGALEALLRRGWAVLVARLVRVLGPARLDLAEEVVQEACVRALERWTVSGVPRDPEAWLLATARNLAVDGLRRRRVSERVLTDLSDWAAAHGVDTASSIHAGRRASAEHELDGAPVDDTLRMLFMCAHPALPEDVRLPLVLKSVCGFGTSAIAAALLAKEGTIAQKLSRARARLEVEPIDFALPPVECLAARLDDVLEVLRLVFNEGYRAHRGEDLVRLELVHEAVHLGRLLAEHPATTGPSVHAFLALVHLLGARLPARVDGNGDVLTLAQQDRSRWDRAWLATGFAHLRLSFGGDTLTALHVEAAIASVHAAAPDAASTDWHAIRREYERLLVLRDDPVVRLNHAVAVAKTDGPAAGLAALDELGADGPLATYALRLATRAQLCSLLGRREEAEQALVGALALPCSDPERRLLERRLDDVRRGAPAPTW
jgi:RNA polymerase sigma-70 factor (ECF subfamily)